MSHAPTGRPTTKILAVGRLAAGLVALATGCGPVPGSAPDSIQSATQPSETRTLPAQTEVELGPLRLVEWRRGSLEPDTVHNYTLDVQAGDAVLLEAEQDEVDLEVEILDPRGRTELRFDSPVGREAPERVCFVAASDGGHAVRLAPFTGNRGGYVVRLARLRPATAADRSCFEAAKTFMAATRRSDEAASETLAAELERAGALWQEAGEPFLAAVALREAGSLWLDLGRSLDAAARFRSALALARASPSGYLEVSLLNRLGVARLDRGELQQAGGAFRQALRRARRSSLRQGEASALHNLALIDETVGEIHRAAERYREALPIWRELRMDADLAQTLKNLADVYALLDHHREAFHLLDEALAMARRTGDQDRQASALASAGWVHYLSGRSAEGIPALRDALELRRRLGDRNGEAADLDRLGTLLRETGDFAGALEAYRQSHAISEETDSPWDAANTAGNIGCLFEAWGRTEEAVAHLVAARDRFLAMDDPLALSHVEFCLARARRQGGDLDGALDHADRAVAIVEGLRGAARRLGERYHPIRQWQDYAEYQLELLMAKYRATGDERFAVRAFEAGDLARSRNLFELVLESRVGVRGAADRTALEHEREIQARLNVLHRRTRKLRADGMTGDADEVADLERQLAEAARELESARARIRAADPRFADLAAPRPVRIEELKDMLDPGTLLLSYSLGEERSYLFAVSRTSFKTWTLETRSQVDAHAEALYRALQQSRFDAFQHRLAARALRDLVLPPDAVAAAADRLLVVADGLLNYVPFGVLPSLLEELEGGAENLLADDVEIHHLASASVLEVLRRSAPPRAPKTVAVFADAVFSASDPRVNAGPSTGTGAPGPPDVDDDSRTRSLSAERLPEGPLPRLPYTRPEAEAILALVPEEKRFAALGFAADKRSVMEGDLEQYRILHFATHAVIDERFPELSGLVLSRFDRQGRPVDGDLHLHEIYGLRLAARLVVLSGCQTALGRRVRGDGLLGLTRGFLYAGTSQVLVSLWSVDDEATAALMTEFYSGLLERGLSPAAALGSAQRWMRRQERWRAPYFWAAFILQGDGP